MLLGAEAEAADEDETGTPALGASDNAGGGEPVFLPLPPLRRHLRRRAARGAGVSSRLETGLKPETGVRSPVVDSAATSAGGRPSSSSPSSAQRSGRLPPSSSSLSWRSPSPEFATDAHEAKTRPLSSVKAAVSDAAAPASSETRPVPPWPALGAAASPAASPAARAPW